MYEQLKEIKLGKSSIAKSEHTDFSRKTIYNDDTLFEYIEGSIRDSGDYFNERQLNKLSDDLSELKELNDNLLSNIINALMLENELNVVKD